MDRETTIRIVIAGGGTGGHVLPAIAVVEELRRREQPAEYIWIGSSTGVEVEAARRAGIPFRPIQSGKFRRYFSAQTPVDAVRVPVGVSQAWRIVRRFRPHVVFSTGGFVSVPTVIAVSRIAPILTHEQTAILGLATRINLRFADRLAVSYDDTAQLAASRTLGVVVTGNPIRAGLCHGDPARGRAYLGFSSDLPILYVTGGARGSSPLNQRLASLLPELLNHCQILHQTGPVEANGDAHMLRAACATWATDQQSRYKVVEFVGDELPDVFAAADLLLARAGAGTVAEIAGVGKASILVPLPGSGGGEQVRNAGVLADIGAALVLPQEQANPERLRTELLTLLADGNRRAEMAAKAASVGRPEAASLLANELLALATYAAMPLNGSRGR